MPYYLFDKCNEQGLENLEKIADLWGLKEDECFPDNRQWEGQTNNTYLSICYTKDNSFPVLVQTAPNKSHLNNPHVKQMLNDLMFALDAINVHKEKNRPYNMGEFKQEF
jgi:hypothetical protein|tara:strand:+ start:765 stop:1091 length:327 start_codon:yes stop_codon:yes gene_type:complete